MVPYGGVEDSVEEATGARAARRGERGAGAGCAARTRVYIVKFDIALILHGRMNFGSVRKITRGAS